MTEPTPLSSYPTPALRTMIRGYRDQIPKLEREQLRRLANRFRVRLAEFEAELERRSGHLGVIDGGRR